jgi:pimeloyl-ACP methyl ester carboxylesterase
MIELSLAECDVLAAQSTEVAERLRSLSLTFRFALVQHPAAAASVHRQLQQVQNLAADLREIARQYDSGENAIAHATSQLLGQVGRALAPAFTGGLGMVIRVGQATRVLEPGAIEVAAGPSVPCTPVAGFSSALERIPAGSSQIRIDRIDGSGGAGATGSLEARYFVYIAGTRDFGLQATTQPWDMTSNLQALSGVATADSEAAVRAAMREAGIDANTPVVLVGHSQGGLIADRIAASGDFNVTDVVTAGAPARVVDVSPTVRLTAFEHTDDLIPALSGVALAGTTALFVREKAPKSPKPVRLPTHELTGYVTTATSADRSSDAVLSQRKQALASSSGSSCASTDFVATRALMPDER